MAIETAEQIRARTQAGAPKIAWQYDPEYERASNMVQTNLAKIGAGRTTSLQRTDEDFDTATRTAGQTNEKNLMSLRNKLANQGIGYSGVEVQAQGEQGQNFQNTIAALTQGRKRTKEDIETDYTERQGYYNDIMAQAEIGKAERQTTYEKEQAAIAAEAEAARVAADQQRQWMADLQARLTEMTQPKPQPTGQMTPPPKVAVQQAVKSIAPPPVQKPNRNEIYSLQSNLKAHGFDAGNVDGFMGPRTLAAYNAWRSTVNMPPVNQITLDDWHTLNDQLGQMNPDVAFTGGQYRTKPGQQA